MAQRVTAARRGLDWLTGLVGRGARPFLEARSRSAILPGSGTAPVPGLAAPADVHFDRYGVPHIRARTEADVFRAQGYCHARDRFFQMDMLRRVLSGRLSEIVGERSLGKMALPPFSKESTTVGADHLMRVLDVRAAAQRVWDGGGDEGRALLGAYAEGVNAAVKQMRRPLGHRLVRLPLEPWDPVDSILVAKGMALGLSFKWRSTPVFAALAETLADRPELLERILPPVPGETAVTVARCITEGVGEALRFLPLEAPMQGSNAWLLGSARSASGRPILASDPHLELSLPAIWYLASMSGGDYEAVGATLPGLPGVVLGRTPTLAWGLTNAMLDDADLWVEELDESGTRYRIDGAWRDMTIEAQTVIRRGKSPHTITVRRTHRGPLLSDAFPEYRGPAISLRLALHEPTGDMEAFLQLGRARTVDEAFESVNGYGAPSQSLLAADTEGNAGYRMIGRVPIRSHEVHPALPRDGTRSDTDWTGYVPEDELPRVRLEPEDQLVSANHAPVGPSYPHYLSHLFEPEYRALRIAVELALQPVSTAADMRALQLDAVDFVWRRLHDAVLAPCADAVRSAHPSLAPFLDTLLAWQGDETAEAKGAVAWHLTYHHLLRRVFEPALGAELFGHWAGILNFVDAPLFAAFEDEDNPWAPRARRAELLAGAMQDAKRDLAARGWGPDTPWGAMHTLLLKHPIGAAAPLASTFNRGPIPIRGSCYTVSSGQYLHSKPGPMLSGASYRQVVDLADPGAGGMITFGGQSGHIGSPHYDDLTPLWLRNEMLPMRLETLPEDATLLRLVPG